MKAVGIGILALVGILALSWVFTGNDFFLYKFFAPKQEAVRRQVFENTPSYVQGKIDYISQLKFEYGSADKAHKQAIAQMIIEQAATVDNSLLPAEQRQFIHSLEEVK